MLTVLDGQIFDLFHFEGRCPNMGMSKLTFIVNSSSRCDGTGSCNYYELYSG